VRKVFVAVAFGATLTIVGVLPAQRADAQSLGVREAPCRISSPHRYPARKPFRPTCSQKVQELEAVKRERDAALRERDAALRERDAALRERDAAQRERDAALAERDAARNERDAALRERDAAQRERDAALAERDAARNERDAALRERDAAQRERDAALAERDAARNERDAALRDLQTRTSERDASREQIANLLLASFRKSFEDMLRSDLKEASKNLNYVDITSHSFVKDLNPQFWNWYVQKYTDGWDLSILEYVVGYGESPPQNGSQLLPTPFIHVTLNLSNVGRGLPPVGQKPVLDCFVFNYKVDHNFGVHRDPWQSSCKDPSPESKINERQQQIGFREMNWPSGPLKLQGPYLVRPTRISESAK
jgi:hypothetical protein